MSRSPRTEWTDGSATTATRTSASIAKGSGSTAGENQQTNKQNSSTRQQHGSFYGGSAWLHLFLRFVLGIWSNTFEMNLDECRTKFQRQVGQKGWTFYGGLMFCTHTMLSYHVLYHAILLYHIFIPHHTFIPYHIYFTMLLYRTCVNRIYCARLPLLLSCRL